jgi:flagellar hook-length control protein FliK
MQQVNALPVFLSQETDLKAKDSSSGSAVSNKDTEFSSLVEQHFPEKNKAIAGSKSTSTEQAAAANQGKAVAGNDDSEVNEVSNRQESDAKKLLDASHTSEETLLDGTLKAENNSDTNASSKNGALAESEQFISLLYNSDQTLAKSDETTTRVKETANEEVGQNTGVPVNNTNTNLVDKDTNSQAATGQSAKDDSVARSTEHKLSGFSKDELLARTQLKQNNTLVTQSNDQVLKDYQLSLQGQQSTTKTQSITSEQLINAQLASAQSNNKISDLAAGVAQANKNKITEKVDTDLYQLPVEPIVEGDNTAEELSSSTKENVGKTELNQAENKANSSVQSKGDINAGLIARSGNDIDESIVRAVNGSSSSLKVSPSDAETEISQLNKVSPGNKVEIERSVQVNEASIESGSKEKAAVNQEKQPAMTAAQLQAQAQQKVQSTNSDQQAIDDVSEEAIDSTLIAEGKPLESSVKTMGQVSDAITVRTASELNAQTIQATQAKQSNAAYFEHQVSEVLNHNVASDTVQIQKNNVQLQQETISIFRKDFADAVKDKVMLTINQKLQQFDITLDPPEFGNMQVRVNLQGEQASVNFVVQNQQAKDALEQNMHKLRDMLSEQGVDVGDANVEQQDQQQNSNEQSLGENNGNGSHLSNDATKEEGNVEHTLSAQLFDSSATGVDYYA